jgi:hypothetical protein
MKRTLSDFLEQFVLPLVRGGELFVGRPVTPAELVQFEQALPHASVALVAVDEARSDAIAELVVRPPALVLDADELSLAAALHNLLFLEHPVVDSWVSSSGRLERVRESAQRFAARPAALDRHTLLARHGLLHNLFDITRTDTTVSWWTGSIRYFGQKPPARLTRWRTVRRVREDTTLAGYGELLGDPDVESVIAELLRLTPLTDLLSHPREGPPLGWEQAVVVLRDPELARAVAYRALKPTDPETLVAAPSRFAAAFERFLERRPAPDDVRAVAAFLVHLNALIALGETRDRDPDAPSPLLTTVLAPERAARRPRGLATFFALPDALARVDPRLAAPPGLAAGDPGDARAQRRWRRHREQVRHGVGDPIIETLASRLRRALGTAPAAATTSL